MTITQVAREKVLPYLRDGNTTSAQASAEIQASKLGGWVTARAILDRARELLAEESKTN